jgi:hypothetical protein
MMMTLSWTERQARRGAVTEREFLATMDRLGFSLTDPLPDCIWTFTHAFTGARRYAVRNGETYRVALERFRTALRAVLAARPPLVATR